MWGPVSAPRDRISVASHYHLSLPPRGLRQEIAQCHGPLSDAGHAMKPVAGFLQSCFESARWITGKLTMRILVVEDDKETAEYIRRGLTELGSRVDVANDGKSGMLMAAAEEYDVAIVDRMLPGPDGIAIVESLRRIGKETPILFLSAMGAVEDRVTGLRAGADDYLTKPFAFSELHARVEALARRRIANAAGTTLRLEDLEMDLISRTVRRGGERLALQPREFALLEYLLRHTGQVVTRTMLLEQVWGYHFDPHTNVIDVHVSRLRRKIDHGQRRPLLHTVRGAGYSLRAPD